MKFFILHSSLFLGLCLCVAATPLLTPRAATAAKTAGRPMVVVTPPAPVTNMVVTATLPLTLVFETSTDLVNWVVYGSVGVPGVSESIPTTNGAGFVRVVTVNLTSQSAVYTNLVATNSP